MNEIDLSYVAGYFDGEGSVRVSRKANSERSGYYYTAQVQVINTFRPAVEAMQKHFGGKVYKHERPKQGYRQVYTWHAHGRTAYDFLVIITPYLHEKKPQAKEVMAFYEKYGNESGRNKSAGRTEEEKADQAAWYQRVSDLKRVEYV